MRLSLLALLALLVQVVWESSVCYLISLIVFVIPPRLGKFGTISVWRMMHCLVCAYTVGALDTTGIYVGYLPSVPVYIPR